MGGLTNFSLRLFIRTKQELRQYDLTLNLHFIFARDLSLFGVYRRAAAILKHRECFERPSIQFHIHDDVFWLVALEHAQPAPCARRCGRACSLRLWRNFQFDRPAAASASCRRHRMGSISEMAALAASIEVTPAAQPWSSII